MQNLNYGLVYVIFVSMLYALSSIIIFCEAITLYSISQYITFVQVWALADSKRQGHLGYHEFVTAMQV